MRKLSKVRKLSKDELFCIAVKLDFHDLIAFCSSSKRINKLVSEKDDIWLFKLKEFPDYKDFNINESLNVNKSLKDTYEFLYNLRILREKFEKINETDKTEEKSLLKFYNLVFLYSNKIDLIEIPKEIGILINLRVLNLKHNCLEKIPKEIGNLTNLTIFHLKYNMIRELPKEIGNLINLKIFDVSENFLEEIPKEIGNLTNLEKLDLSYNKLKEIPKEIGNLLNLRIFYTNKNQLQTFPKEIAFLNLEILNLSNNIMIDTKNLDFTKIQNLYI